mmetsp:Transcript_24387/g.44095  ORF Transcript_24387/g.44095 Transcript_24387/m.44095 type:complete len:211 (+) Transcript_24387:241-873(+)
MQPLGVLLPQLLLHPQDHRLLLTVQLLHLGERLPQLGHLPCLGLHGHLLIAPPPPLLLCLLTQALELSLQRLDSCRCPMVLFGVLLLFPVKLCTDGPQLVLGLEEGLLQVHPSLRLFTKLLCQHLSLVLALSQAALALLQLLCVLRLVQLGCLYICSCVTQLSLPLQLALQQCFILLLHFGLQVAEMRRALLGLHSLCLHPSLQLHALLR